MARSASPHRRNNQIFSPETDPESIPPKRTYRRTRYFSRGEFARLCLAALRRADRPLATAEIVVSVIKAKGLPDNLAQALTEKTLAYMRTKLATASIVKTGKTQGARWALSRHSETSPRPRATGGERCMRSRGGCGQALLPNCAMSESLRWKTI
jgi:hypothetical protein